MKKIAAVCGHGLGSSFMVEMNIKAVLKELGVEGIEVEHYDLASATPGIADLIIVGADLADNVSNHKEVLVIKNIISKDELLEKLSAYLKEKGVI